MADEFAGVGVDDADVALGDEHGDGGAGSGAADADVVEPSAVAQGDAAVGVDGVVAGAVVRRGGGVWVGFETAGVCVGGGASADGSVGAVVVVVGEEAVDVGLERVEGLGGGLGGEELLEGLVEAFDFAAGLGVRGRSACA